MEKILQRARENMLADSYGKFDLVETIFPIRVLLNTRPRQLKRMICEKLEIELHQMNYKTFISWLSRFRKKHQEQREKEKANPQNDWGNYIPAVPVSSFAEDNAVVLKKATYQSKEKG